jgi:hypothetical protein
MVAAVSTRRKDGAKTTRRTMRRGGSMTGINGEAFTLELGFDAVL